MKNNFQEECEMGDNNVTRLNVPLLYGAIKGTDFLKIKRKNHAVKKSH